MFKILVSSLLIFQITAFRTTTDNSFLLYDKSDNDLDDFGYYMPDGNGQPRKILMTHDQIHTNTIEKEPEALKANRHKEWNIRYLLYTRSNTTIPEEIIITDPQTLRNSHIDWKNQIKILIHGWKSNYNSDFSQRIKDKYLEVGNHNVIVVDWSCAADGRYREAARKTNDVAKDITNFIKFLVENGAKYNQIHFIGHSLGAHISGGVGFNLGGRIGRITGLDPAKPFFDLNDSAGTILSSNQANFVDVIHTCSGTLGISVSLGRADFYPNGGSVQPGCGNIFILTECCSHSRAWELFEESIGSPNAFPAVQCESFAMSTAKKCENGAVTQMGEAVSLEAQGNFYLFTSHKPPFRAIQKV